MSVRISYFINKTRGLSLDVAVLRTFAFTDKRAALDVGDSSSFNLQTCLLP